MSDSEKDPREGNEGVSRRRFLQGLGAGGVGSTLLPYGVMAQEEADTSPADGVEGAGEVVGPGKVPIELEVNGESLELDVEPRATLLDVLRQGTRRDGTYVDLTGNKRVCDRASCGACSMIVDGELVYGCTYLAIEGRGKSITTVEGLGSSESLHAVQQAFVEKDALMCGFCTPGMVVAVAHLLDRDPDPSRDQIRRALDGNICRCGTYARIFEAAESAAARLRKEA